MCAEAYTPRPAPGFKPARIILTRGSTGTPARRALVEAMCRAYPHAAVVERADVPHNRVALEAADLLELHQRGKRTLVLGVHRSAVRQSQEDGNTCPNYCHFSPYGFCPYGCHYCYLAGTQGVRFSPTVKVFVNLPEIMAEVDRVARSIGQPTAFYLGKLQDGLALDPLTGYSRTLVPFFAEHPFARMTLLTKSLDISNLLDLDHRGHTILSWSLNPDEVIAQFEENTPPLAARLAAMKACAAAGYPMRAVIMPIVPIAGWEAAYARLLESLLSQVPLERLTLGGICSYPAARNLMERKLGPDNLVSRTLAAPSADGRMRYPQALRVQLYRRLIEVICGIRPDLAVSLCLEEREIFDTLGLAGAIGRCNCVL
jgi:spore photoproduct lyase